ncbi:O-antigen ligase [Neorhodopirellula lusitana]|uniref:O-antigen ligase n=1 Tax=Neorhodopirellula lusitana TaxID=445327 RepID=A0ABY1QLF1_9BACT|nr:O-antigen ligase family protein [Neorhodopirellula lusitana]SMP74783.1 O-antigen ligase [Neorhodopirellula lusitana]
MFWIAILFLFAALPWFLPVAAQVRPYTAAVGVLVLGTVLGPAFFAINGPIQLSLDRILWAGLMLIAVMRLARGNATIDPPNRFDLVVIGLVGWTLFSCVRFGMTNIDPPPFARWLFYLAIPCSMYFAMRIRQPSDKELLPQTIHWLSNVILVLGVYLSITSVLEMLDIRALVFPRYISDPEVWEFYGRGRGPLLNPAGNGILMTLFLSVCVARFFNSARHGKALYAVLALIALAGCYSTLTRSVWMGAALTLALLGLLYVPVRIRVLALIGTLILGGVMTTGLKDQILSIKRDKALSAAEAAKSVELRPLLAVVAWEMFRDNPLAGHGYGQYLRAAEPYHAIRYHGIPLETVRPYVQHNVFLAVLVDLGLVGLAFYVLFLVSLFCITWRLCCQFESGSPQRNLGMMMMGLMCSYVANGMFHDVAVIEMIHMYLFAFAGLTMTVSLQAAPQTIEARPSRRLSDEPALFSGNAVSRC